MVRRIIIAVGCAALFCSCAQVGTISGGMDDTTSPQIKEMTPENKSVNFTSSSIEIEFEEFIKLNNPSQTITVIPPDFKVNATVKGKTLTLSWEEMLQPETTYSIFLNKTVQDITEANDSIVQIVFSTGDKLDSLSYGVFVKDVLSQQAVKNVLVGLFSHSDSLKPIYFAQTNTDGKAEFNYLKSGHYFVRTFDDFNKDLKISNSERVGFSESPVFLMDSSFVDSIPLTLFTPALTPSVRTFQYQAPGAYIVGATASMEGAVLYVNGTTLSPDEIDYIQPDSLRFYFQPNELKSLELVVTTPEFSDTVSLRMTDVSKNKNLAIQPPIQNRAFQNDEIAFTVFDEIDQVDTSKIQVLSLPDSSILRNYSYSIMGGVVAFDFMKLRSEKLVFAFTPSAISGKTGKRSMVSTQTIRTYQEKEVGVLNLDLTEYTSPLILEVLLAGKVEQKIRVNPSEKLKLANLIPGEYTFKVSIDTNNNGLWDTGNFETKSQPEEIQHFSEPTMVRANWEIELKLVPKE